MISTIGRATAWVKKELFGLNSFFLLISFFLLSNEIEFHNILTTNSPNPGYADSIGTISVRKAHPP